MTRSEIWAVIKGERDYQDSRWGKTLSGGRPGSGERSVDEFALYLAGYTAELVQVASHYSDMKKKLDVMRKIAGLCVACFEQHGCPERNPF